MQLPIRRKLGIFYTPESLARLLVEWALDNQVGPILDPSFGGCAFLTAALQCLEERGVLNAGKLIHGFDIDGNALPFAQALINLGVPPSNLVMQDFLSSAALTRFSKFSAVVGNPPYIRHHVMTDSAVARGQRLLDKAGFHLPLLAGGWAYFTLLSAHCVAPGGNLALILPGTLLHASYGADVLKQLESSFAQTRLLHVHERLFPGTHEESVILLARGRGGSGGKTYQRVTSMRDLPSAIRCLQGIALAQADNYKYTLLPADVIDAWQSLRSNASLAKLGDVATIRIGVVTGANSFFIRNANDPLLRCSAVSSMPIVTKKRWLSRPSFGSTDLCALDICGEATRLLRIRSKGRIGSRLRLELDQAERAGLANRHHCSRRKAWYQITDDLTPDVFLPYMSAGYAFMVRNDVKATCTNAIHRIDVSDANPSYLVASSFSTLFAFESEFYGRHYGGGILKLEPSAAGQLSVAPHTALLAFRALQGVQNIRSGDLRSVADELFLENRLGASKATIAAIRRGTELLARERRRPTTASKTIMLK